MLKEIDQIEVTSDGRTHRIVLAQGNLARIDAAHRVDLLVISAFPGDYTPTPTSMVGQLARNGVSVGMLAKMKAMDLRAESGAWLSPPVDAPGFERLVCFEPEVLGAPPAVVGELFRALFPFLETVAGQGERDLSVAMPLIATGDAGWSDAQMMAPLLEAATRWMKLGLPISTLYIVAHNAPKAASMQAAFAAFKQEAEPASPQDGVAQEISPAGGGPVTSPAPMPTQSAPRRKLAKRNSRLRDHVRKLFAFGKGPRPSPPPPTPLPPDPKASVFLSYSSTDRTAALRILDGFRKIAPQVRVFEFRRDIPIGVSYQSRIDDALAASDKVLCLLSPEYIKSPECQEELMVARLRNKRAGFELLWPVYWREVHGGLKDWLMILNLADCRESSSKDLDATVARLASELARS